jgi:Flp pilus assembly CpaE family ATPase
MNVPLYVNDVIEQALSLSNPIFLVAQDSISMLRNLNMLLQRLPKRGIATSNLEVIHNRAGSGVKAVKSNELEKLIRDVPLHKVRNDYRLAARAENEGKPAGELQPRAGLVKDMTEIAQHIASFDSEKAELPKRATRRWFS